MGLTQNNSNTTVSSILKKKKLARSELRKLATALSLRAGGQMQTTDRLILWTLARHSLPNMLGFECTNQCVHSRDAYYLLCAPPDRCYRANSHRIEVSTNYKKLDR